MRRVINNIRHHSNWLAYYFNKYLNPDKGFTFRVRGGIEITVPKRMLHTYKEQFFDHAYLKGLPDTIELNRPLTVVDIGANVGYFSLYMLSKNKGSKVIAFEPLPANYELLKKYKEENPALNLTAVNKAVAGEEGRLTLGYDETDNYSTSASIFEANELQNRITVPCTTLEAIVQEYDLSKIDFLKLDCEGSEYPIIYKLSRAVLNRISVIAIETHEGYKHDENTDSLVDYLKRLGFQVNRERKLVWVWRANS